MSNHIEITEEAPDHKFRTETPNLIIDLLELKALKPTEVCVYTVIKRIAGDGGSCFCSNKTLASKCRIGKTLLAECIKTLEGVIPIIGSPLIRVYGQTNSKGGSGTNKIVILDCWRKNGDYFRDKRDSKEKIKDVATRTRGARVPNEGCSRAEHKEEQGKKNPYNNNCLVEEPISSPPSDINKFITKHGMQGQKIECSFLAVIQHGINEKLNWVLPEIEEAWNVLAKYKDGINNYIGFIVSTINNLKKKSKSNFNTKGKTKCKATATVVPLTEETKCGSYKPRFLGDALRELASQHLT